MSITDHDFRRHENVVIYRVLGKKIVCGLKATQEQKESDV